MQIVWKLIGDRLGGIYSGMKRSSTILPGRASTTLSRTKLDLWRTPAGDLSPWTISSIRLRPGKLHLFRTRSLSRSNEAGSNSSTNSLRTCLPKVENVASGHPSPSQPTPQAANLGNYDQTNRANQAAEDNRRAYRQHPQCQQKFLNDDVLPANDYIADLWTTLLACALNAHEQVTHRSRTRH